MTAKDDAKKQYIHFPGTNSSLPPVTKQVGEFVDITIGDAMAGELEQAKELLHWSENREPTLLEYLRYYKNGVIKEIHIEAAIDQQKANLIAAIRSEMPEKEDEHPVDPETGAAVETYGYEAQHNQLVDKFNAILDSIEGRQL